MNRRLALGLILLINAVATARAADDRPNVVLIVADDLGGSDLGCYGSKFHRTPNLDRLAAEGRRFTQAYAACPVCSPTRAALMTGKYPARLHLTDWLPGRPDMPGQKLARPPFLQHLPLEEVTLAETLKGAGYATAHIGKWHLGGAGFEPTRQGFDLNVAGDHTGTALSYFAPFAKNGRTMPGLADAPPGQYLTDRLTIEAERFLDDHKDRPFFLYMPHYAVHTPMAAQKELIAKYPKWDGTPHGRQENPIYAAMLESLDESVGRIVAKLDQLGIADRTIVVFTSDNGGLATREGLNTPATNNAPLREGKGWLYEGGIRVPLIVRWPGKIAPGVDATPVWSGDLAPTLEALAGAADDRPRDGVSLAGLLTRNEPIAPRALYWHYPHYANQNSRPGGAIREGDWKLIESYESGRRELYDLKRDPKETTNRAEEQPSTVAALAAQLDAWRRAVAAQMPTPNPAYTPNLQAKDGTITLPAQTADVHGVMLRYEPLPHKNTLGFWVRADDWASWEFEVRQPGTFNVEALVGCGKGSGGSVVEFRVGDQVLRLNVPVTGGFQQFETQDLGRITLSKPGRATLEVRPLAKPGGAVMDLRQVTFRPVPDANARAEEPAKITHGFLATGGATYIRDGAGKITWSDPRSTRDGWSLPNGNLLLTLSKSKEYPGGAVVEVTPVGKTVFEFRGTQSEVNTAQAVDHDRILLTEAGDKPRLLEVTRQGEVAVELPLQAQTKDHHLQTRMARKLANGNYLVPQLLDKVVKEYSPKGDVVRAIKTPDMPFTAIRLDDGNTLIGCTHGNLVVEVDPEGKTVWQVSNDDLPGDPIQDACGVQRLPNGNTVVTSYHTSGDQIKLMELTPAKAIVWTHRDPSKPGIHHFQILDTNGTPLPGRPLR